MRTQQEAPSNKTKREFVVGTLLPAALASVAKPPITTPTFIGVISTPAETNQELHHQHSENVFFFDPENNRGP